MLPHPLTSAPCACAAHNNSHCYATVTQKLSQPDEHLAQNVVTNAHVPLKMLSPYAHVPQNIISSCACANKNVITLCACATCHFNHRMHSTLGVSPGSALGNSHETTWRVSRYDVTWLHHRDSYRSSQSPLLIHFFSFSTSLTLQHQSQGIQPEFSRYFTLGLSRKRGNSFPPVSLSHSVSFFDFDSQLF